jgi:tyrosine-specific transport protein
LLMPKEASFVTMAERTLGSFGYWFAWVSYLILLFSLMASYLSGGADLLGAITDNRLLASAPWVLVLSCFFMFGVRSIDHLNRLLVMVIAISFMILIWMLLPSVDMAILTNYPNGFSLPLIPILITAFGYQVVIPSVKHYQGDKALELLPKSIVLGSLIALFVYVFWTALLLAVIPNSGPHGMDLLMKAGQPALRLPQALVFHLSSTYVGQFMQVFSFSALASSFLGIGLAFYDFLKDGTKIHHKVALTAMTLGPAWLFSTYFPQGFLLALHYAGYFVVVLNILLPAVMSWKIRTTKRDYNAPLGAIGRIAAIVFSVMLIGTIVLVS